MADVNQEAHALNIIIAELKEARKLVAHNCKVEAQKRIAYVEVLLETKALTGRFPMALVITDVS